MSLLGYIEHWFRQYNHKHVWKQGQTKQKVLCYDMYVVREYCTICNKQHNKSELILKVRWPGHPLK